MKLVSLFVFIVLGAFAFGAAPKQPDSAPETTLAIVILGDVHKPGKYQLPPGSTVWTAIDQAGGFSSDGWGAQHVRIERKMKDGSTVVYRFEVKKKQEYGDSVILQDGDRVLVPIIL